MPVYVMFKIYTRLKHTLLPSLSTSQTAPPSGRNQRQADLSKNPHKTQNKPTISTMPILHKPEIMEVSTAPPWEGTSAEPGRTGTPLVAQFQSIIAQQTIPDNEFHFITQVLHEITQFLQGSQPGTQATVELYRNNYLQFRNHWKSHTYLVFMCLSKGSDPGATSSITREMEAPLLAHLQTLLNFRLGITPTSKDSKGTPLFHPCSGISLKLASYPLTLSELQLSRLVTYYSTFDPRITPLLSLVSFWAKINSITLAKDPISGCDAHSCTPDPTTLEWLLLFFLYFQEKLIPPPKLILNTQLNPALILQEPFNFNSQFAQTWRRLPSSKSSPPPVDTEPFVFSVVTLLLHFFQFYTDLIYSPCVLNTLEGELLHPFRLYGTSHYCANLYNTLLKSGQGQGGSSRINFVVTHPLVPKWRLSLNPDKWTKMVRPKMQITAEKLRQFINGDGMLSLSEALSGNDAS